MATYIAGPFDVDPDVKKALFVAIMQGAFPGWVEDDSRADSAVGTADASIAAQLDEAASETTTAIFRFWAARVVPVPPIEATAATGLSTWTMVDNAGYTVPAGTTVAKDTGDGLVAFEVAVDFTVAPGDTVATGVTVNALEEAAAGNDLTGALLLIDSLAYVASVSLDAATSGGLDAEDDDVYLSRATTEMQTLSLTPILPRDFALLARSRVDGVYRVLVVDGYDPTENELQSITGTASGGNGTLTWNAQTTGSLVAAATAPQIQTALEALSNIAVGDVNVTGGPLGTAPVIVEFKGAYRNTNVAQIVANVGSLTGGTWTVATTHSPTVYDPANTTTWQERMVTLFPLDETGANSDAGAVSDLDVLFNGDATHDPLRETNFVVNIDTPTRTTVNVAFTFTTWQGYDSADVKTAAEMAVTDYLSPALWGVPNSGDPREWESEDKVRLSELYFVLNSVNGLRHVTALTVNSGTSDVTLAGVAPLPTAGTVVGTAA